MLESFTSGITIQRHNILSLLSQSQSPTLFYKNNNAEKDTICQKMKKLIDFCYVSCKAIIKFDKDESLTGCTCYSTEDRYIIHMFKNGYVYVMLVTPTRIGIDTSGTPLSGAHFTKTGLSKKLMIKLKAQCLKL